MKQIIALVLFMTCSYTWSSGQSKMKGNVLFWNVENLFDCHHDSLKNDYDFLPESLKHWTFYRYREKIKAISQGILIAGEWNPPMLIGLCEVENDSVLRDLTQYSTLKKLGYRYLITHSSDIRGIDVALLYRPELFKPLSYHSITVGVLKKAQRPTRDILHVTGLLISSDTIDLFIAHLPSRYGGRRGSEPNRIQASKKMRESIDSLQSKRPQAKIIVMGDFNDYPTNKSVQEVLQAKAPTKPIQHQHLYHLLARKRKKHWGTYKFQNSWGVLDHFIVTGNLLDSESSCYTSEEQTQIIKSPLFLIEDKKYGGVKPFRTYNGMHYLGGFSDHLPVRSTFIISF